MPPQQQHFLPRILWAGGPVNPNHKPQFSLPSPSPLAVTSLGSEADCLVVWVPVLERVHP